MWKKRLKELKEERKELRSKVDNAENMEALNKLEFDLRKLDIKISEAEEHVQEEERNARGIDLEDIDERTAAVNGNSSAPGQIEKRSADFVPGKGFRKVDETNFEGSKKELRKVGNELVSEEELERRGLIWQGKNVEERSVVLDETILIPEHQAKEVAKLPFNEVSSILDLVKVTPFENGESYDVPFEYEVGEADYTAEVKADGSGGEYSDVDTKFDSSKIKKAFVTAYTEISKQFLKSPAANYGQRVQENIVKSVRKKLAKDIIVGVGGENAIQGILTQPEQITTADGKQKPNRVIDKDIEVSAIDANTITDIVFKFGGDNDVEEGQVLIMNKLTLNEFAKLRDGNGNRSYDIKTFGGSFTIDGIRGVFSSHIKPFSSATEGEYFIAYGSPQAYEIALFSQLEVEESKDFKFKQGMNAYRADEFVGGNITAHKAWVRVKKVAQVAESGLLESQTE